MTTKMLSPLRVGIASFMILFLMTAICEAKSFRIIVGYASETMEIPIAPGRISSPNGGMPRPASPQMNTAFPPSGDIQTVVPAPNPLPLPSVREPAEDIIPQMDGGFPRPGVPTPASLKAALDSVGRTVVAGITFEFDSADLTPESGPSLQAILGYLKNNPGVRIKIEGHCDTSGDTSLNPVLSQNRADAVKNWLIGQGADGSLLNAVGMSDAYPIADNSTPEGQAKNRRVELVKE
ncbi:MAG TPA: OmpA family protein [Candidatus Ozemobacteraceae bacterium]|nr:OmpA family protein [Candidatus Ozemobacteraceae bacterium]